MRLYYLFIERLSPLMPRRAPCYQQEDADATLPLITLFFLYNVQPFYILRFFFRCHQIFAFSFFPPIIATLLCLFPDALRLRHF